VLARVSLAAVASRATAGDSASMARPTRLTEFMVTLSLRARSSFLARRRTSEAGSRIAIARSWALAPATAPLVLPVRHAAPARTPPRIVGRRTAPPSQGSGVSPRLRPRPRLRAHGAAAALLPPHGQLGVARCAPGSCPATDRGSGASDDLGHSRPVGRHEPPPRSVVQQRTSCTDMGRFSCPWVRARVRSTRSRRRHQRTAAPRVASSRFQVAGAAAA
jgi:hypothetical protein